MSNRFRTFAVLTTGVVLAAAHPTAAEAAPRATAVATTTHPVVLAARSYRAPSYRAPSYRPRTRARPSRAPGYRRPARRRGVLGGILRALGLAYLFHALFGWGGGGGSPFGLLLLAAIVLLVMSRRRRRVAY